MHRTHSSTSTRCSPKWQIFKNLNIEITSLSGADNGLFAETAFTVTTASVQKTYDVPVANDDIRKLLEVRYDAIGPEKYWPVVRYGTVRSSAM